MKTFFKTPNLLILFFILSSQFVMAQGYNGSSNQQKKSGDKKSSHTAPPDNPDNNTIQSPLQPVDVPESGCGAIWHHLGYWSSSKSSESAAAQVGFSWYEAPSNDDGRSVISDPVFPGNNSGKVAIADSTNLSNLSVNEESPDIKFEGVKITVLNANDKNFEKLRVNSIFSVNAKTNKASFSDSRGLNSINIDFFDANQKGEMWGRCKINNKKYFVRMNWKLGKKVGKEFSVLK